MEKYRQEYDIDLEIWNRAYRILDYYGAEVMKVCPRGVCRDFTALLLEKMDKEIKMPSYKITTNLHTANFYKMAGEWYVADLTLEVQMPDKTKGKPYFCNYNGTKKSFPKYMLPLEIWLTVALKDHNKDLDKRVLVEIRTDNGDTCLPLNEFLKYY